MAEESKNTKQVDEKTTKKEVKSSSVKKPRINSSSKKSEAKNDELKEKRSITLKLKKISIKTDDNFNWDELTNNEIYSKDERLDLEKTYTSTLPNVIAKQVIDGKVVTITDREVVVDINFKSDGVISFNEFKYNEDLKIGDIVEVLIEKQEDKTGQLILSHRRARVLRAWEKVNDALANDLVVNGKIKSRTKGGMIVDVFGIECFLPGSQIDVKPIRDYDEYVGKEMEFKVVKVNESFRNVVVSHKALIEADLAVQTKEIMSKLEKGQVLEGTVKNITSYGVFVDLGGIDGLIHIT